MKVVHANRLLRVADSLRDAAKRHWLFDMGSYGWSNDFAKHNGLDDEAKFVEEHKCGTPACALGHYAVRGDLQRRFTLNKAGDLRSTVTGRSIGHDCHETREHFGLGSDDLEALFDSYGCGGADTPLQAARFIEKFIRNKGFVIS